jgi:hypothetical protein
MSLGHSPSVSATNLLLDLDANNTNSLGTVNRNIFTFPETFSNAAWSKGGITAALTTATTAPDGTLTANIVTEDTLLQQHLMSESVGTVLANQVYTISVFAKAGTRTQVGLTAFGENYVAFDLLTGTVLSNPGGYATSITSYGNGWYRVSATITKTNLSSGNFYVLMWNNTNSYLGTGTYMYWWGAQVELGSSMTTYYPVSASTQPSTTWTNLVDTTVIPNLTQVEVLVVAGGGGGTATGSGGGAGGLIYNSALAVTPGTSYTATVGAGGVGGPYPSFTATNGSNSVFGSLTAIGGGRGVSHGYADVGISGGSGGGAAIVTSGLTWAGGLGTANQGFNGGAGMVEASWIGGCGGGGGAGGPGRPGANAPGSGNGGPGLAYDISGTMTYYAGGGGGGEVNSIYPGTGGIGGGGSAVLDSAGTPGTPNTGGGGGGGSFNGTYPPGGGGGSGVIIARYPLPVRATGGNITVVGNNAIHTFTSGTSSFVVNNSNTRLVNSPWAGSIGGVSFLNLISTSSQVVNTTNINLNQNFTLECWVYMNTVNGFCFFGQGTTTTSSGLHVWMNSATSLRFGMFGNDSDVNGLSLSANTWYHFAFTYTNASPWTKAVYINGVAQTLTPQQTQAQYIGTGVFRIGSIYSSSASYANGYFGVARVYNRVLTADEVLDNFNALRGRYGV